jgi:prevent-host-death family protein
MTTVTLTEFRRNASGMLTEVDHGETIVILRHRRPIAKVLPVEGKISSQPSWKRPGLCLSTKGSGLSSAILEERNCVDVS